LLSGNDAGGDAVVAKKSLRLSQVYRLIEPGPVVMVTTASGGRANIMAAVSLNIL
jgi:flavin reductase (DIM6/NTAB) family NADH-FMN oxidoreductase RutF